MLGHVSFPFGQKFQMSHTHKYNHVKCHLGMIAAKHNRMKSHKYYTNAWTLAKPIKCGIVQVVLTFLVLVGISMLIGWWSQK